MTERVWYEDYQTLTKMIDNFKVAEFEMLPSFFALDDDVQDFVMRHTQELQRIRGLASEIQHLSQELLPQMKERILSIEEEEEDDLPDVNPYRSASTSRSSCPSPIQIKDKINLFEGLSREESIRILGLNLSLNDELLDLSQLNIMSCPESIAGYSPKDSESLPSLFIQTKGQKKRFPGRRRAKSAQSTPTRKPEQKMKKKKSRGRRRAKSNLANRWQQAVNNHEEEQQWKAMTRSTEKIIAIEAPDISEKFRQLGYEVPDGGELNKATLSEMDSKEQELAALKYFKARDNNPTDFQSLHLEEQLQNIQMLREQLNSGMMPLTTDFNISPAAEYSPRTGEPGPDEINDTPKTRNRNRRHSQGI